jgi:hypothetical protein
MKLPFERVQLHQYLSQFTFQQLILELLKENSQLDCM